MSSEYRLSPVYGVEPMGLGKESGGEAGIRTLDRLLTYAGFQDRCIQPLCHLSADRDRDRGRILGDSANGFNYCCPHASS